MRKWRAALIFQNPFVFLLVLALCICQHNGENISETDVLVFKANTDFALKYLEDVKFRNKSTIFLLSLDWSETNETINKVVDCLTKFALYNQRNISNGPWELWLNLNPRYDGSEDLDATMNITTIINRIYNGTITTFLLDYGLLQITTLSVPVIQQDLKLCAKKSSVANIRCGITIDSINCVTSLNYLPKIGLSPGTVFIVSDDVKSFQSSRLLTFTLAPCLQKLENSGVLLGYKMDFFVSATGPENSNVSRQHREKRSNVLLNQATTVSDIVSTNFIIVNVIDDLYMKQRRKFKPLRNFDYLYWLAMNVEFEKDNFGVGIGGGKNNVFEMEAELGSTFSQFHTILIETADLSEPEFTNMIQKVSQAVVAIDNSLTSEIMPVMHILYKDFKSNKNRLDNILAVTDAENIKHVGVVKSIAFDWTGPLQDSNKSANSSTLDYTSFLNQAEALLPVLKYAKSLNRSDLHLAVMWEVKLIEMILRNNNTSSGLVKIRDHLDAQAEYIDTVIFKASLFLEDESRGDLLYDTRTLIFILSAHIEHLKYSSSNTSHAFTVKVYIGINGCTGGPYTNVAELTNFVLFWEIIRNWASTANVFVFMDQGYETYQGNDKKCQRGDQMVSAFCSCGWWLVSNTSYTTSNNETSHRITVEDKKTILRRLYEQSKLPPSTQSSTPDAPTVASNKFFIIWLPVTSILFCAMVVASSAYLVSYFRSKNILTKREVHYFLFSSKNSSTLEEQEDATSQDTRYNKARYEILPSLFSIDMNNCLGEGEFAAVYKGILNRLGESTEIAVKMKSSRLSTGSQRHANLLAVKGLVSEIKILSYVKDHPNIVKLKGAYTAKLRKGTVILFLEFCSMGSLDKYLHAVNLENDIVSSSTDMIAETSFTVIDQNASEENEIAETTEHRLPIILANDLVKWSNEIASGMQYLAAKKLVHADLATRNILLDGTKTAKISDFGLSRRLYNYSEYVKNEGGSLPWRWMAPESFRRMVFTEKTDVWAFGVTLWEMYTLGDLPYPGLSYDINFPTLLDGGVRLPKPKYSSNQTYRLMKRCWENNPEQRPSFGYILQLLGNAESVTVDID